MKFTKFGVWALIVVMLAVLAACAGNTAAPNTAPAATQPEQPTTASQPAVTQTEPTTVVVEVERNAGQFNANSNLSISRGMDEAAQECVACHKDVNPGIIRDWRDSRHGHVGVSCLDCHQVEKDAPNATQHETLVGTDIYISILVPPSRCSQCHSVETEQFDNSGHFRAYRQIIPKDGLRVLTEVHEGRNNAEFGGAPAQTGCMQCHGTEIKLDADNRPTNDTWPNAGIGNIYPDGSTGNCTVCHTRHKFSIEEARKPEACASCHLGPDHPDIEIYNNTKHGQIYATEGDEWKWDSAPDAWEPGDYRAPTCAVCHMSGIGELQTTHNVSDRLYWNLWAPESKVRNSNDPMNGLYGNGNEGREKMKLVCNACHSSLHTDGFFEQGDRAVQLYNVEYYAPAKKMLDDLKSKGLLKDNPWDDEFQKLYYYLWHHEGRRARQGAMMGGPDYAHWHGFFELQQTLYKMQSLYEYRIENNAIEKP